MFKLSTGLRNHLAVTGSMRAAMTTCAIKIYAGTEPADADAAIGAATLLTTITVNGDGVTALGWEAAASNGVLLKAAAEVWQGTNVASGTAAFFRLCTIADTGAASTSLLRAQGTCAVVGGDLNLSNLALVGAAVQTVDNFAITTPAQ